jgi:single-stranded DNA-binding protein
VYIEGTLRTREYTDQNGIKRYTTEIVAGAFSGQLVLLESKPADQTAVIPDNTPAPAADDNFDDDIPF